MPPRELHKCIIPGLLRHIKQTSVDFSSYLSISAMAFGGFALSRLSSCSQTPTKNPPLADFLFQSSSGIPSCRIRVIVSSLIPQNGTIGLAKPTGIVRNQYLFTFVNSSISVGNIFNHLHNCSGSYLRSLRIVEKRLFIWKLSIANAYG